MDVGGRGSENLVFFSFVINERTLFSEASSCIISLLALKENVIRLI